MADSEHLARLKKLIGDLQSRPTIVPTPNPT